MRTAQFLSCCAVKYLHSLDTDSYMLDGYHKETKLFEKELIKKIKKIEGSWNWRTQLVLMILDEGQYHAYKKILKKYNFKVKQKFEGNDSGWLYLMTKEMNVECV